MFVPFAGI